MSVPVITYRVDIEIALVPTCGLDKPTAKQKVKDIIANYTELIPNTTIPKTELIAQDLHNDIHSVKICEVTHENRKAMDITGKTSIEISSAKITYYVFRLEPPSSVDAGVYDNSEETAVFMKHCLLPSIELDGIWESLEYEKPVKDRLLNYAESSLVFGKHDIDPNIISWNRMVLLHGVPGTGKTSLCKGIAQKLAIRMNDMFNAVQFMEINSHNLFSKYYSESGKLVMQLFSKIKEQLEYGLTFVVVLIDEVESLTHARRLCMSGSEPSDSIRVVNAILTQLDDMRRYPNILILTTTNIIDAVDDAFLSRADLQLEVNKPSTQAAYRILVSSLQELIERGVIDYRLHVNIPSFANFNIALGFYEDRRNKKDVQYHCHSNNCSRGECIHSISVELIKAAKACEKAELNTGRDLRKAPFLAYSIYKRKEYRGVLGYVKAITESFSPYNDYKIQ